MRITLDGDGCRIAGHARPVGLPIRGPGRLGSRGGFRRLGRVTGVTPVRVTGPGGTGPVTGLQESLDFLRGALRRRPDVRRRAAAAPDRALWPLTVPCGRGRRP
ncbi:hypothetical protein TPA0910_69970 [Streptomyces hygroscopicus subsp. sporocinereus]|uniref:Uncharacterized protein n=1 Tax=Streptomyces hygroscopicus TaxID=1912 RepID=A0ABQ3UAF9_STRHY|nr:hypothetical protein TPA0910_69970 [Streptomyces hygroscopicus]